MHRNYFFKHLPTTMKATIFPVAVMIALCLGGVVVIIVGFWQMVSPLDQERVVGSSAMRSISRMGESLRQDIASMVRPQIVRTHKLAQDAGLIAALRQGDPRRETEICNWAITQATEIDAFALFDRHGNIVAINTVYASGEPIQPQRVARIMGMNFGNRDIIQKCFRNGAKSDVLEFQTTCDITPAFFDSSGLSVAYSVPVMDPATGGKIGVVSSRLRFDRLTDLIKTHDVAGKSGSAEFVTDDGGYFSEEINTGKVRPPVPISVLSDIIAPLVQGKVDEIVRKSGADYLCLLRLKEFETVSGHGIQVMLVAKGDRLATEDRQAKQLSSGAWIGCGLVLLLAAALVRGVRSLQTSEQWNRLLIESTLSGVVTTDDCGIVECWNPQAERIFGYTNQEARGQKLTDLVVPSQTLKDSNPFVASQVVPEFNTFRNDSIELQLIRKDGVEITADVSVTAIQLGRHVRYCVFLRDITEFKLTQSHLIQAQKLESIGQLASGVAHEINTPAQYVGDNVRFLQEQFGGLLAVVEKYASEIDPSAPPRSWAERRLAIEDTLKLLDFEFLRVEIPQAIEQSLEGLNRVVSIVSAMKDFSHPGSSQKELADLNRSISSTIEVCRNRWKFVANLTTDFAASLPAVPCLIAEFNQVILNLIVNAADAISEQNANDQGKKGHIHVTTAWKPGTTGGIVEIRIQDDGPGIPANIRQRMFEPFFTTKPVGKGTGQGLAISRIVIVAKHRGELFFESTEGVGTTFVIRLPVQDADISQAEAA